VRTIGVLVACVFLALAGIALAQKVVAPPQQVIPSPVPSQPPSPGATELGNHQKPKPGSDQEPSTAKERGTQDHPVIVKVLSAEKTDAERAQEQQDRLDKSSADWWLIRLTGALAFVGILQFAALIGQAIVFRVQAKALRESVNLTREISGHQERDMRASITEAGRAAVAMEQVASGIAASVENTNRMAEDQRNFWSRQMRAYVFVQTINIYNVADPPTPTPSGQQPPPGARTLPDRGPIILIAIRNFGHTPASTVVHLANVVFREFPLTASLPEFDEVVNKQFMSVFSIPPTGGATKNHVHPILTEEQVSQLRDATAAVYVYGKITYTDTFGVERETNYRFRHNANTGVVGITGELTGTEQGNDST
jgi:hypothetical protein